MFAQVVATNGKSPKSLSEMLPHQAAVDAFATHVEAQTWPGQSYRPQLLLKSDSGVVLDAYPPLPVPEPEPAPAGKKSK